ncbi:TadE/TadG family type IV pilus assembly protein [Cryobacterium frigoriphilum]|uniref:TadE/TadG family type IV pilus assembly protein n=1 Tax=Cryobacterium frigoriphilum TaxID=1259150 RepID=UPI001F547EC2|nr:TadE/TadG family type IV pilus assembly protein [Cryobacterium frigoriphilum]
MRGERGAAAVEFALVLPVIILLVFGGFEFGRVYNVQISLSNAAREGARYMAIHHHDVGAVAATKSKTRDAAPSIAPVLTDAEITVSTTCTAGTNITVTITRDVQLMTGYFGASLTLTGKGVMSCGG